MRKFLLCYLIVMLANLLYAQSTEPKSTPRSSTPTPKSISPPPSAVKLQRSNPPSNNATDRSSNPAPATLRTNTSSSTGNLPLNNRTSQTTSTSSNRSVFARPSAGSATSGSTRTAKNIAAGGKNASKLNISETVRIKWITIEEAVEKNKTEKRKIFIDVVTPWCGWCKHMDSTTFTNPTVAQYLNEHYYAVKFNAEQQQDIIFKDKTYHFKREGARGYHELAAEWLNNRLSFPTVVFLDENLGTIQPLPGYQDATKLEAILNYFGTDSHKTTPWETYERKFNAGGDK